MEIRWKDGKIIQKSEFETTLEKTVIVEIENGGYNLNEMALLWLYCKAWGAHGQRIISYNFFWKFHRDNLREVLFDLNFPDPDEPPASKNLHDLLKAKIAQDNKDINEWSNSIYKESIETIPKCKLT